MTDKGNFGRRTWDREEYAEKAKLRYENAKNGKQIRPSVKEISRDAIDFKKDVGKVQVITGNITGTRGKGFGFHCEACDLTFKDNLKYVQHLNSPQHLYNTGQKRETREVTLEEVKQRYEFLVKRLEEKEQQADNQQLSLSEDIERRKEKYEQEQAFKKQKEKEKIEAKLKQQNNDNDSEMQKLMGFGGFGSTKK